MELILREHVDKLGRRGDIVKVKDGYARNYLVPRGLALPVTEGAKRQVAREKQIADEKETQERQAADAIARKVTATELRIARKVGETGSLYGSVTTADIAELLAAQGVEVDRRKIQLDDPIKELGEYTVHVKLHRDVTAPVRVSVVKEEA